MTSAADPRARLPISLDAPDFASAGDRVWEVRVYERGTLSAVIWVNAETGGSRFLAP